jgi:UDP-N-acetylmuramoyl-L-alanyl-D-glutamate--2,6-diaminopimelate ligase
MNAMLPITALSPYEFLDPFIKGDTKVSGDSREIKAGDVLLAYPVGNERQLTDSRLHITNGLSNGAALVLYEPLGLEKVLDKTELDKILANDKCIAIENLAEQAGYISAYWYKNPSQLMYVVGVTGTNGKTTVTQWIAKAFQSKYKKTAVIGTLGAGLLGQLESTGFTTPDATRTQALLNNIYLQGANSVALEVSSHALDQHRVNGVEFDTVIITNLTQDHLDYHGSMVEYAKSKKKILDLPGIKNIIINADDDFGRECLIELTEKVNLDVNVWAYATQAEKLSSLPSGSSGKVKKILAENICTQQDGMAFDLSIEDQVFENIQSQLIGTFNISNSLAVFATLICNEYSESEAIAEIKKLKPIVGRMELVRGKAVNAPMALVDFAHTPDALEQTLKALRPIADKRAGKLWCVFGCGGDRDNSKRPLMGAVAEQFSDQVMVTSDNQRSEDPEKIISEILSGCKAVEKIQKNSDRATAILQVIRQAHHEDVVLVAGKGHEEVQEILGKRHAFSDQLHLQLAMGGAAV